jgi:replicative DNA helicase
VVQSISNMRPDSARPSGGAGRVPPHNIEAEESLLGAMLLSKDAIASAVELVSPEDFYKPAHGHLYEAIQTLYGRGEPVDPVTVAEELRRANLLEALGGKQAILRIQVGTPAAANAAHYARIVEEHALLRRLIAVAGEIAEMGYDMPEDVTNTLDRSETLIFEVANRRLSSSLKGIYPALQESLEQLESLFERDGSMTGVPSGFVDLDEITLGFQPSNLIVVAARPGQGKTSLALGAASHVALETRKPVVFFSMEMGYLELTQRMLASEAGVNSRLLRTGRIPESDWTKISHAVGRLAEAPFYIDDNAHLTVMEMRAKCRRLKALHGDLGLVVVDYLQLMSTPRRSENRQVEVSELSRGLKILARDLETPVMALSQLNRSLEYRTDKRPMLADLRESGCLTGDTRLLRADDGSEITLAELVRTGARDIPVWSLDESWRLVPATLTHAFPSGTKPVFRLRLASGRELRATANHKFRTVDDWVPLGDLAVGSRIAVPRLAPGPDSTVRWPEPEIVLLAHLLGDGSIRRRQPLFYVSTDEANLEAVRQAAESFGVTARREQAKGCWRLNLPAPFHLTHGRQNPIAAWLDRLGVFGCRSHEKFVPPAVFELPEDQLVTFLRHLWATDGSVTLRPDGQPGPAGRVYYATTSRRLADDVQGLLLRLGIQSRLKSTTKQGYRACYQVDVYGVEGQQRFCEIVGVHGERGAACERLLAAIAGRIPNPNADTIPAEIRTRIVTAMARAGISHRDLAAALGEQYCGSYLLGSDHRPRASRRDRVEAIARAVEDKDLLRLATSDVAWDRIVAIEPLGEEEVFDATVLGTHNFVANGVVAHNSIEQDADIVMFIYRDDAYNPESSDKGTAEIIVAKHRNGPTAKVRLAFLEHLTKFANMARG